MKKQEFFKLVFTFLLLFTSSILVIGCRDDVAKVKAEKAEGKQLMKDNSENANEVDVVLINASGPETSQVFSVKVKDEIQIDEWIRLVKDIKSTLSEMEEESKQVLVTSEPR